MLYSTRRAGLLGRLQGQTLRIPDLQRIFQKWPQAVNPNLEELRPLVPGLLQEVTSSVKEIERLNKADFALFSATWWPMASLEAAHILTCVAIWLFLWDDEIDAEVGALSEDFAAAQRYREETARYVKHCLGLSTEEVPVPSNKIIALFKIIGDAVCGFYPIEHREVLFKELDFFWQTSELEQRRRLSPNLPTLAEYINCRQGTSAVGVTCFFMEYAQGKCVPVQVLSDPDMKVLWDQTNIIIWAVNDLLSIKKEVAQETVDSLVPILYHHYEDMDMVVAKVVAIVEKEVQAFDRTAEKLLEKYIDDADVSATLRSLIDTCRYNCTGNLYWSLRTGRYGIGQKSMAEGTVIRLK